MPLTLSKFKNLLNRQVQTFDALTSEIMRQLMAQSFTGIAKITTYSMLQSHLQLAMIFGMTSLVRACLMF